MHIKSRFTVCLGSLLMLMSFNAYAEDARGGLYLSGGVGWQTSDLNVDSVFGLATATTDGLHYSVKLGAYLNPEIAVYATREYSLYSPEDTNESEVTYGFNGAGISYYFNPTQGGYLEIAGGFANTESFEGVDETAMNLGILLGAGYEILPQLQVGGAIMSTLISAAEETPLIYSWETFGLILKAEIKL